MDNNGEKKPKLELEEAAATDTSTNDSNSKRNLILNNVLIFSSIIGSLATIIEVFAPELVGIVKKHILFILLICFLVAIISLIVKFNIPSKLKSYIGKLFWIKEIFKKSLKASSRVIRKFVLSKLFVISFVSILCLCISSLLLTKLLNYIDSLPHNKPPVIPTSIITPRPTPIFVTSTSTPTIISRHPSKPTPILAIYTPISTTTLKLTPSPTSEITIIQDNLSSQKSEKNKQEDNGSSISFTLTPTINDMSIKKVKSIR